MRPGCVDDGGGERANAGLLQKRGGLALLDERLHVRVIRSQFAVERLYALGEPYGFGASSRRGEVTGDLATAGTPGRDLADLLAGQPLPGIDPEFNDAHERGQGVDAGGSVIGHVLTSGDQGAQGRPHAVVSAG